MWSVITELFNETGITLPLILFCGVFGILAAVCISVFNNEVLGRLVKKMLKSDTVGIKNAKALSELGFSEKGILSFCLKKSSAVKKTVFSVKSEKDGAEIVRYYISEENVSRAASLYKTNKSSLVIIVVAVILLIATAVLAYKIVPDLIQMASNLANKTQE